MKRLLTIGRGALHDPSRRNVMPHTFPARHDKAMLVQEMLLFFGCLSIKGSILEKLFELTLRFPMLHTIQQERVVADFSQFHLDVHQLRSTIASWPHIQEGMVVLKDRSIVLFLDARQFNVDHGFFLGRNILGNVFFDAAKHVRRNYLLQSFDLASARKTSEVHLKDFQVRKFVGLDEVQERPEFLHNATKKT